MRWLISIFLANIFSVMIADRFFGMMGRPLPERIPLVLVTAAGLGVLIFQLIPRLEAWYRAANYRVILLVQAALAGAAVFLLNLHYSGIYFLSLFALGLASILPFAPGYDYIQRRQHIYSIIASSVMAVPLAFFAAGFLSHSYPNYLTLLISILCLLVAGLASYAVLRYIRNRTKIRLTASALGLLAVTLALLFALALTALVLRYPNIFDRARFLLTPDATVLFLALSSLAPVWLAWTLKTIDERGWLARWQSTRAWAFVNTNLPGLVLGGMFALGYTVLGFTFNHPGLDQTENFLAIDNFAWMGRLANPNGTEIEMRAVHPFAFFVFRPVVWLLSLLFNGDRYAATLLLVPLTGGLCVFLAYLFIKRWSGSGMYALLAASLLGASTAHLVFGSFVESYIFSAAVLLLFFVLLLEEKTHFLVLVAVGTLTFGITITNFIQTFLGYVVARPKFKSIFMFGLLASALSITLTVLHAAAFPSALLFFDPAGAGVESDYSIPLIGAPAWRVAGRAMLLVRNIFLYSLVAPQPFILTEEVGGVFPRFNFFKIAPGSYSYSSYDALGKLLVLAWLILLLAAGLVFLWKLLRARKFDLTAAFPLVILFNFALHMTYGYEPFLYAADWTYALVLFVAASLSDFGKRRWFQIILLVFIALLMVNQWNFIRTLLEAISPFFK
jgi:hypothetical protein